MVWKESSVKVRTKQLIGKLTAFVRKNLMHQTTLAIHMSAFRAQLLDTSNQITKLEYLSEHGFFYNELFYKDSK